MPNSLPTDIKDKVRELFLSCGNIKRVARELKVGKNTVRRLIKSEGLVPMIAITQSPGSEVPVTVSPTIQDLDFRMLEKLFRLSGEPTGPKEFERHIKSMAVEIASEIGVRGRLDITRLEVAVCEYVQYRRLLFCSLEASDKNYCGPFAKSHDKVSKAVLKYVEASNRAFENFSRICRELEVKYGKRGYDSGKQTSVYYQHNQQINVGTGRGTARAGECS